MKIQDLIPILFGVCAIGTPIVLTLIAFIGSVREHRIYVKLRDSLIFDRIERFEPQQEYDLGGCFLITPVFFVWLGKDDMYVSRLAKASPDVERKNMRVFNAFEMEEIGINNTHFKEPYGKIVRFGQWQSLLPRLH